MKNYKCTFALMLIFCLGVQGCGSEEQVIEELPILEIPVEDAPVEDVPVEEIPVEEAPAEEVPVEEDPVEEVPVEEAPAEEDVELSAFELAMAKCNNPWNELGVALNDNSELLNDPLLSTCYRVSGVVDGLIDDNIDLSINGAETLAVASEGQFEFVTPFISDETFILSVKTAATKHQCNLINNSGTINDEQANNLIVHCIATTSQCDKTTENITDDKNFSGNNIEGIESLVSDIECGVEPWREAANERINNIRKTSGTITIVDKNGEPVTNAKVNLTLNRHNFKFGGIAQAKLWHGEADDVADLYKAAYLDFGFNKGGFQNALKYKLRAGLEPLVPAMLTWFKAHDIPVRGHALIWPKWTNMETTVSAQDALDMGITQGDVANLPSDELKIYVDTTIRNWASKWDVVEWDVANELRGHYDVQDILGYQEEAHWYKLAKANVQNSATLFINDNRIISDSSETVVSDKVAGYKSNVESILADDTLNEGHVEALGFQSRFGSMLSADTIYQRLSYFDDLNLPISATEFEIKDDLITTEIDRAVLTERVMTVYFSKESVSDILVWTFFESSSRSDARHLVDLEGNANLRGKTWLYLVKKHWNTDVTTWLDRQGETQLNGFKGEYTATVSFTNYPDEQVDFSWIDGTKGKTIQLLNYANGSDSATPASFSIDSFENTEVEEGVMFTSTVPTLSGDDNIGAITWTVTGDDANLFNLNSITGVLSLTAQDFESPADTDIDNNYAVILTATDAVGNFAELALELVVTDNLADNQVLVNFTIDEFITTTIAENVIYSSELPNLSGDEAVGSVIWTVEGDDANLFVVDSSTGALTLAAQDFENANDLAGDNDYLVTLVATDSEDNFAQLALVISVTNVDEVVVYSPPEISGDNGDISSVINAGDLVFTRPALATETTLDGGAATVEGNKWKLFNWSEAEAYCSDIGARLPTKTELSDNLLTLVNDADLVSNGSFSATEHWPVNKGYWASTFPEDGKHHLMKTSIDPAKMSALADTNRQYVTCVR
ncbi:endo-1,4-beta-xylanase [Colwellia psychrerythraea]|uniref:Glycosyl hydrolase, family 10 n=1 Tax=Colwellia psychrerythraea (strain 34H / ATCC BAA-681) TaxID=167879 RepID=Q482D1_COLP3|nr:endo-1,4-beta-xylanase [Colwellia psychrerythraea]AAZ25853.1 glycosyl hydrolase, family 10 [Colwellia psychrerythraea 34H]